jgi:hypothetical protein
MINHSDPKANKPKALCYNKNMKIERNPEIDAFFRRCRKHLTHDTKNQFVGRNVTRNNHDVLRRQMKAAGFAEFQGPEDQWPSLWISTHDFLNRPYPQTIRWEALSTGHFRFDRLKLNAGELFNAQAIVMDPQRELNESMVLRALDESYDAPFLWQSDEAWMMDVPSEALTIDLLAEKAAGHVLAIGLGIGYYAFMALRNPAVKSVTVIENSVEVIDLFERVLHPQFPRPHDLHIVHGDAFEVFTLDGLVSYDTVFVDIWRSAEDGYPLIERLLSQTNPPLTKLDLWIEDSCFEFMPSLIFLYFEGLAHHRPVIQHDPFYARQLRKIARYFEQDLSVINSVDELKHRMYDRSVLRAIAATKVD